MASTPPTKACPECDARAWADEGRYVLMKVYERTGRHDAQEGPNTYVNLWRCTNCDYISLRWIVGTEPGAGFPLNP